MRVVIKRGDEVVFRSMPESNCITNNNRHANSKNSGSNSDTMRVVLKRGNNIVNIYGEKDNDIDDDEKIDIVDDHDEDILEDDNDTEDDHSENNESNSSINDSDESDKFEIKSDEDDIPESDIDDETNKSEQKTPDINPTNGIMIGKTHVVSSDDLDFITKGRNRNKNKKNKHRPYGSKFIPSK